MARPTHHLQAMRYAVEAAIKSGNSTWCRTLATTHEDLAVRLRLAAGYKGEAERNAMKASKRIPPPRFTPLMVDLIQVMADDKDVRTFKAIRDYLDDDGMANRVHALFTSVGKTGGEVIVYTKGEKHVITVAPS